MKKCAIEGCTRDAYYNPITGDSNILCSRHLRKVRKASGNDTRSKTPQQSKPRYNGNNKPGDKEPYNRKRNKSVKEKIKVELFVLRGHTLTINYTGKTKHVNVNRLTRAVKYNADKEGSSGKIFHYVIDIKQGTEVISNILFDNKAERDREFEKIQILLSRL
jgi:hypothetical protein